MSREGADHALRTRVEERDRISGDLLDLESHTSYQLLKTTALRGKTLARWTAAQQAMARMWSLYDAYRIVLRQAEEVRARRARPGPAELDELTFLLAGPSVRPAAEARPVEQRSLRPEQGEALSLDETVAQMDQAFRTVGSTLTEIDTAWTALLPRLELAATAQRQIARLTAALGETPSGTGHQAELDRLRSAVTADPLDAASAEAALDRLCAALDSLLADLTRADALRRSYGPQHAALLELVDKVGVAEAEARRTHTVVAAKILLPSSSRPRAAADRLSGEAAALDPPTGRPGPGWVERARRLETVERAADAALNRARATTSALLGLMARRDELRGRLLATQAKAVRVGLAEDPEATGRFARARQLLWTAPCDLNRAAEAVEHYQDAIHGGPR
ncbi:coiled-coil domain-containing protein [Nonomuraea africana]|uniref:CHAD domain-containing protein n=1 Tax=Nonomuraea africana TaxID=46171 RepID=A0ABR9KJP7_9ACTN|nr:hypothetical protein [Nonomuraea africana]MBE1562237.1 hypothetical protein [Nonomuraea africana]